MRALRAAAAEGHAGARQAIALFGHRLLRECGSLVALLGGLDLLAFTGGIGEHDALLRATLVQQLGFLGLALDDEANRAGVGNGPPACISAPHSAAEVWVVLTDEGRIAAAQARALLSAGSAPAPRN